MEKARRPARPKKRPVQYRHEPEILHQPGRLRDTLKKAALLHAAGRERPKNGGEYFIRSLYFDSPFDDALWEKLAGVNDRDKFRIRAYNGCDDVIKLECKHKEEAL